MNNKAFNVALSLTDNNTKIVKGVVQYDSGNLFRVKVMSGGEPFDFTGYTDIVLTIVKPDGTSIVTEQTEDSDYIQLFSPETGEVHFQLGGQATLLVGMHFAALSFYGDGMRTTTAKLNYFVEENNDAENIPDNIISSNDWQILTSLISKNSLIETAESARVIAELAREAAELSRASETAGIISSATALSNAAQQYAEMARAWAAVTFATAIPGDYWNFEIVEEDGHSNLYIVYDDALYPDGYTLPVLTQEQLEARLAAINCGVFGTPVDKIQILRGLFEDLPTLDEGEMAWATDTKQMYIGTASGNQAVGKAPYIAQATEPTDTSILWIDTANSNIIKYHNGSAWVATNTAIYA